MMENKILLINDGLIALVSEEFRLLEDIGNTEIKLDLAEYGATLILEGIQVFLPSDVLTHLEKTDGANIYFYVSSPYELIAEYQGCISLGRDEILKLNGALEYGQRL